VNAFGVDGTNAHVVLEAAPAVPDAPRPRAAQLFALSARSDGALAALAQGVAAHLHGHDQAVEDVASTLGVGRRVLPWRAAVVAQTREEAARKLGSAERRYAPAETDPRTLVFVFPGQGAQHFGMARDLHDDEPVFRRELDAACDHLRDRHDIDLRRVLYTGEDRHAIDRVDLAQLSLLAVEISLAALLRAWGIVPDAVVGHSLGEYSAAVAGGIMSAPQALDIVVERGRLMLQVPDGALTAVERPAAELEALMPLHGVHLSAVNAERSSVLGGSKDAVDSLEAELRQQDIPFTRLATEKAFHTPSVEPICAPFEQAIQHHRLTDARVRMVSTVTADWVQPGELAAASYWARQIRQPVRFAAATALLAKEPRPIFLEIGPQTFTGALQRAGATAAAVLPRPRDQKKRPIAALLEGIATLWQHGVPLSLPAVFERRGRRVALPTYPFERQEYWVKPA
jgi:acyl transferase domain-containing protein